MPTPNPSVNAQRLSLASGASFTAPGAGQARRAGLTAYGHRWLSTLWGEATSDEQVPGTALAAVGSLARGDAGPLSDYDLVLLHASHSGSSAVSSLAERLWYPLWDAGVRLDHAVRSPATCREVAHRDLSAAIGLLDLSWVAGDRDLVTMTRSMLARDWRATARRRLDLVLVAMNERHARFDTVSQSLEPDLKEAQGGLRDMAVLRALAQAWLADRPHGDVDTAHAVLLDVRDAVHVVAGRPRDRLVAQDRAAVAALLGHDGSEALLADVARVGRTIADALDQTARRAGQSQRARTLRSGPRRPTMRSLGHGLYESDGELVLGGNPRRAADPVTALRAGVLSARIRAPIAAVTARNLAALPPLPTPWPRVPRDLLVELLASGPGLVSTWSDLERVGIVDQWLPEWARVRSAPQSNPLHRHTVDRHLLETVVHAAGLSPGVPRPDLLLIAALLHDIGKTPGARDHCAAGWPIAMAIASRVGFEDGDAETIGLLVREHLTLMELATGKDPADPGTARLALAVVHGRGDVLDVLAALTQADALATGPRAWTSGRARLLRQLVATARSPEIASLR